MLNRRSFTQWFAGVATLGWLPRGAKGRHLGTAVEGQKHSTQGHKIAIERDLFCIDLKYDLETGLNFPVYSKGPWRIDESHPEWHGFDCPKCAELAKRSGVGPENLA